jgi:CDP-diacylglycerol--serine O-phosphatidyltransferase
MKLRTFAAALALAGLIYFFKEYALLGVCLSYIFFGLIRHWRRPSSSHLPPVQNRPTGNV